MNRWLSALLSPETVLLAVGVAVFAICARHSSGEGADVALMERMIWLLPLVAVPLAFATVLAPRAKHWWWLARAVTFSIVLLGIAGYRIVQGFGSGAKGQDAALIIVFVLGVVVVSLATAISGAVILAEVKPAFAAWFRARPVLGSILTLGAAVPIGLALGIVLATTLGFVGGLILEFWQ